MYDEINEYSDIINMPHHVSYSHKTMAFAERAAQFAPFAALDGYDSAVKSAEIKSDEKISLSEEDASEINRKLHIILEEASTNPEITVVFFEEYESHNKYVTFTDKIKSVDLYNNKIIFYGDFGVPIENIYKINGEIFEREMMSNIQNSLDFN